MSGSTVSSIGSRREPAAVPLPPTHPICVPSQPYFGYRSTGETGTNPRGNANEQVPGLTGGEPPKNAVSGEFDGGCVRHAHLIIRSAARPPDPASKAKTRSSRVSVVRPNDAPCAPISRLRPAHRGFRSTGAEFRGYRTEFFQIETRGRTPRHTAGNCSLLIREGPFPAPEPALRCDKPERQGRVRTEPSDAAMRTACSGTSRPLPRVR
jgi:hypothetical protein